MMLTRQSRRSFVASAAAAGALLRATPVLAAQGPLETTTIRLAFYSNICLAPTLMAEELLRAEGFTDVRYVRETESFTVPELVARGEVDFGSTFAGTLVYHLDNGAPVTALAGVHAGCYELFAHPPIATISELKGKSVAIQYLNSDGHQYLAIMAANVGLDPQKDLHWVTSPDGKPMELFVAKKVDAYLAFPPEPQELAARHIGRTIISTVQDKPWSQYLCCTLFGGRQFVQDHPIATKCYLRAVLKAADYCANEPKQVAQRLADSGFARYDYALRALTEIQYRDWRQYDLDDTMRFYALRLREAGMVRSNPNQLVAEGIDSRFFDELKRELKT